MIYPKTHNRQGFQIIYHLIERQIGKGKIISTQFFSIYICIIKAAERLSIHRLELRRSCMPYVGEPVCLISLNHFKKKS
jgi:hypothetical protein